MQALLRLLKLPLLLLLGRRQRLGPHPLSLHTVPHLPNHLLQPIHTPHSARLISFLVLVPTIPARIALPPPIPPSSIPFTAFAAPMGSPPAHPLSHPLNLLHRHRHRSPSPLYVESEVESASGSLERFGGEHFCDGGARGGEEMGVDFLSGGDGVGEGQRGRWGAGGDVVGAVVMVEERENVGGFTC